MAIDGYAEHIANSNMEEINAAWRSIMRDEKNHYGMFLTILRKNDSEQYVKHEADIALKYGPKDPMQTYRPNYDRQIILNNVREDIKGELEAVILYEQHYAEIPYDDIRQVYYEVSTVEKGHVEHLTELLLKYDQDQYNAID